nr:hypothetical protein [Belnapia sp. F-4-1]
MELYRIVDRRRILVWIDAKNRRDHMCACDEVARRYGKRNAFSASV